MNRCPRRRKSLSMPGALAVLAIAVVSWAWPHSTRADDGGLSKGSSAVSKEVQTRALEILRGALQGASNDLLKPDDFVAAMHAGEALSYAGHQAEVCAQFDPLLPKEKEGRRRCGWARELVRAGDLAPLPVLLEVLASKDVDEQIMAAESLYKIGQIGDGMLMRGVMEKCPKPVGRLMAAGALARAGSPDALKRIRNGLTAEDKESREIAAWLLGRLGNPSDIPALSKLAKGEPDDLTKNFTYHALAFLGNAEGRKALEQNLAHANVDVRSLAAETAGMSRYEALIPKLVQLLDDPVLDVRVRAAEALLYLTTPVVTPLAPDFSRDVYPATAQNPRASEGAIVLLRDGSLLYATSQFEGGAADDSRAQIVARKSTDGGLTWGEKRVLQENTAKRNVMDVSLARLGSPNSASGPLGMFFLNQNGPEDLKVHLRVSHDEGATFGPPLVVTADSGYFCLNNDRITRLTSGRLIVPVAWTTDGVKTDHYVSLAYLSDDGGKTWRRGRGHVDMARRGAMEPEVIELTDGRLLMMLRCQMGYLGVSYSKDGGETWSEAANWGVKAPESPATLRRIPATGDLLLIWNNNYVPDADHSGKRNPLTAAVSGDEGHTWQHIWNLEERPGEAYAYTSVTFAKDRALLSYYIEDEKTHRISSRFRSIAIRRFYEP